MQYEEIAPDFETAPVDELIQVLPMTNVLVLASSFYESAIACLSQLDTAARRCDWTTVKEQAHDLKGISGTFGALRLQQLAEELEHEIGMSSSHACTMLQEMRETFAVARREIEGLLAANNTTVAAA